MINPTLKVVVVASGTVAGEFSLRAIKGGKQVPIQLVLKDAGFVPGDLLQLAMLEEWTRLNEDLSELERSTEDMEFEVSELKAELKRLEYLEDYGDA